jgi:hypothetical protein
MQCFSWQKIRTAGDIFPNTPVWPHLVPSELASLGKVCFGKHAPGISNAEPDWGRGGQSW